MMITVIIIGVGLIIWFGLNASIIWKKLTGVYTTDASSERPLNKQVAYKEYEVYALDLTLLMRRITHDKLFYMKDILSNHMNRE